MPVETTATDLAELREIAERATEAFEAIRLFAQDMLDNGHLSSGSGAVGNAMAIRDLADKNLTALKDIRHAD